MSTSTYCPVSRTLGRQPEQLLPAIPYLLGYAPTDSLVCLFFDHRGEVRLSSRVDWDTCLAAPDDVADTLAQRGHNCGATSVLLAAVDAITADWDTIAQLCGGFLAAGLALDWAGECTGQVWRGLECSDICGTHVLDPHCATVVGLIADGNAPAADRQSVVAEVAPSDDPLPNLMAAGLPVGAGDLEIWRDDTIEDCMNVLRHRGSPTDRDIALIAAACCDVRVRDVILWRLTMARDTATVASQHTWDVLATTLRRAPTEAVAPVGAVAALVAWQMGEGTRAMECLKRAHQADPGHSLAQLVFRCVDGAHSPSVWWHVMACLDEFTCRHGETSSGCGSLDAADPGEGGGPDGCQRGSTA